jgi:hypothetical protein
MNLAELRASQLAVASLRLLSTDLGRIAVGASHHSEGHPRAALRVFGRVLLGKPMPVVCSVARDNLGSIYCTLRDYPRALTSYVEANRAAEGRWKTAITRMVVAFQLGDKAEALRAAELVDRMEVDRASLGELAEFFSKTLRLERWTLTARASRVIPEVRATMSSNPGRICDALQGIEA